MINISTNSLIFLFAIVVFRINLVLFQQVPSLPALVCGVSIIQIWGARFYFCIYTTNSMFVSNIPLGPRRNSKTKSVSYIFFLSLEKTFKSMSNQKPFSSSSSFWKMILKINITKPQIFIYVGKRLVAPNGYNPLPKVWIIFDTDRYIVHLSNQIRRLLRLNCMNSP